MTGIRAKASAELQETESPEVSAQTQSIEETAQTQKKIVKWNARLLRVALPVAACLVIAVLAVVRFVPREPSVGGGFEGGGDLYTSPYTDVASIDELENMLGMEFALPPEASEISCSAMNNQIGYVSFFYQDHFYELAGSKESGEIFGEQGTLLEEEIIDSEYNAILSVNDYDGLTITCITWSDGENRYFLSNMDGCSKDEMKCVYFDR